MHWIFENTRKIICFPRNKHDWVVPGLPDPTCETIYMSADALRVSVQCNRSEELNSEEHRGCGYIPLVGAYPL